MKYWIVILALAAVVLTGCSANQADQTTASVVTTAPDPGCYVPDSVIQLQTNGAVRQYAIEQAETYALEFMGEDVLLMYADADSAISLQRLTGENCSVAALSDLPGTLQLGGTAIRAEGRTLAYFNASDNSVVYLNDSLLEINRRKLPHTITRQPVLGNDLYTVFYNVASEVYAADMKAGIARLVRQYGSDIPVVERTLFGDSILLCSMVGTNYRNKVFISSVTGSPLGTDNGINMVSNFDQTYILQRDDGTVGEILFGIKDASVKLLLPEEKGQLYPTLSVNGAVAVSADAEKEMTLGFYDLSSGVRTSAVQLPQIKQILGIDADDSGKFVWIIAADEAGQRMLLRWDLAVSAVENGENYSCERFTLENPDQQGVDRCQQMAEEISQKYGVNVVLLQQVKQPQEATIRYEHQVDAILPGLEALDNVMAMFPEGFFASMKEITGNKGVNIGLVRGVDGMVTEPEGLQYWVDGEAHIALVLGENMEKAILHELSHVLDTYIYTNSVLYDEWNDVNPAGFSYDENYEDYLLREESPYLKEGNQSFIDSYSMSFAKEDRARILEYALTEGNETMFASTTMQNKLLRVCRAIRDAYGWKKDTRTFPWEQYLNKSLAYVEKKK